MAESLISATISDKKVVSNFVGSLPLQRNCSFEDVFYSQTFGTPNLESINSCVSLERFSEILSDFADEKTIDFLNSYRIFIPDKESIYIEFSLMMKNSPSIRAIVFSIAEDSILGFDRSLEDVKFSIMPKEKNLELYYSFLINHEHYHEVFENFKEPIGMFLLKYQKGWLSKMQSEKEHFKRLYFSVANVVRVAFDTLHKVNPIFNVSGDFTTEEFEFEHVNQYYIGEAIILDLDVLDFLIAKQK